MSKKATKKRLRALEAEVAELRERVDRLPQITYTPDTSAPYITYYSTSTATN